MAQDLEQDTKTIIRSLLTSSPSVITIENLIFDHKNTIGRDIPFQQLGYNSLEHFLKSIPDTVVVKGNGPKAQLYHVMSPKTHHIDQLVTRQKVCNKKGSYTKNLRRKIAYPVQVNFINQNMGPKAVQKFQPNTKTVSTTNNNDMGKQTTNSIKLNSTTEGTSSIIKKPDKFDVEKPPEVCSLRNYTLPECENIDLDWTIKKFFSSQEHVKKSDFYIEPEPKFTDSNINHNEVIGGSVSKIVERYTKIPNNLKMELQQLIREYKDGIWCIDLLKFYRAKFKKKLDYKYHGYRSVQQLCFDLPDVFVCVCEDLGQYKLYDCQTYEEKKVETKQSSKDIEPLLTTVNWKNFGNIIPDDVCKLGTEIPRHFLPKTTKAYDEIDVIVGEVHDPSKFWICCDDSNLDKLMDEIQIFYKENKDSYLVPEALQVAGLYCTQIIFGEYHRALIIDSMPNEKGMIKLLYIDYGTVARSSTTGVCFLLTRFSNLPWQMIRTRLANTFPVEQEVSWPLAAAKRFQSFMPGRKFRAKVIEIDWKEEIVEVYLADVTDKQIFYLNDILVKEGYAVNASKDRRRPSPSIACLPPLVQNLHLFPTFDELEYGLAVCRLELHAQFANEGLVEFIMPHYFQRHPDGEALRKSVEEGCERRCRQNNDLVHDYDVDQFVGYIDFDCLEEVLDDMKDIIEENVIFEGEQGQESGLTEAEQLAEENKTLLLDIDKYLSFDVDAISDITNYNNASDISQDQESVVQRVETFVPDASSTNPFLRSLSPPNTSVLSTSTNPFLYNFDESPLRQHTWSEIKDESTTVRSNSDSSTKNCLNTQNNGLNVSKVTSTNRSINAPDPGFQTSQPNNLATPLSTYLPHNRLVQLPYNYGSNDLIWNNSQQLYQMFLKRRN
ncbi:uncharacterized protein LOC109594737 isoform X2 [Aethina tumida]|uniref:uncharacterized protein LOC109594737 isoform X2 n=1 Tax=Aethina tumida TaxID=116153 RepID=UPI0021498ED6|nr:uncharacterized protein LOC109594737 isoform X2 [Aethina tumida]